LLVELQSVKTYVLHASRQEKLLANFFYNLIEMAPGIWRFFHI
jgi:hypothetical protein